MNKYSMNYADYCCVSYKIKNIFALISCNSIVIHGNKGAILIISCMAVCKHIKLVNITSKI